MFIYVNYLGQILYKYIYTHIYYWSAYIYNTYILINRNLIHTHIYIYIGIFVLNYIYTRILSYLLRLSILDSPS